MKKTLPRDCPICFSAQKEKIFRQQFSQYSSGSLMSGYDVVICQNCGGVFADDLPQQDVFDRYYAGMSKYENPMQYGALNTTEIAKFKKVVDLIEPFMKTNDRILDVGCATGGLLAELKKRGFINVTGADPSVSCAETARQLYDIEVNVTTINGLSEWSEMKGKFDFIIMTGVMEHVREVNDSLIQIFPLLSENGKLCIGCPDASRFGNFKSASYQFFSMEHVNFFSPQSMNSLMRRLGFVEVSAQRTLSNISAQFVEPIFLSIFAKKDFMNDSEMASLDYPFYNETVTAVKQYIQSSTFEEVRLSNVMREIAKNQTPVAVWGVGTHTLRLLETSDLSKVNIVGFIDSNPNYAGKTLYNIPIKSPQDWTDGQVSILISSPTAENEIRELINELKWPNTIICLYDIE
jgi:2-polyprenyl-3-methyl-5-hydroxy-6-metoxy-1,4-benzoquinol methylase